MITKEQLQSLSRDLKIDSFTVFREYLQIIFLNFLYQEKNSEKIFFKGGTSLRLLFASPRFSEDLDFSTMLPQKTLDKLLLKVVKNIQKEIIGLSLKFIWQGKDSFRYRLNYNGEYFKFPLNIRLDFSLEKNFLPPDNSSITSLIPVSAFAIILHLNREEIFAEKIRAFMVRAKGRDIFDIWYLLAKGIVLQDLIVKNKLKKIGLKFNKNVLLKKINEYSIKKLEMDLAKFLPKHLRKIVPQLKQIVLERLKND